MNQKDNVTPPQNENNLGLQNDANDNEHEGVDLGGNVASPASGWCCVMM